MGPLGSLCRSALWQRPAARLRQHREPSGLCSGQRWPHPQVRPPAPHAAHAAARFRERVRPGLRAARWLGNRCRRPAVRCPPGHFQWCNLGLLEISRFSRGEGPRGKEGGAWQLGAFAFAQLCAFPARDDPQDLPRPDARRVAARHGQPVGLGAGLRLGPYVRDLLAVAAPRPGRGTDVLTGDDV